MKKLLLAALMLLTFTGMAHAYEMDGDTAVVYTFTDLIAALNENKNIKLMNDIDAKDYSDDFYDYLYYGTYGRCKYSKVFDGNNKTISNLTVPGVASNYGGIVRYADGATIKNLTLSDLYYSCKDYTGGICGRADSCIIENCHVIGTSEIAYDFSYMGGIVGYISNTTITGCTTDVTVNGEQYVGGIFGYAENNTVITDCTASGTLIAHKSFSDYIGGIGGYTKDSTIKGCNTEVNITCNGDDAGGILVTIKK